MTRSICVVACHGTLALFVLAASACGGGRRGAFGRDSATPDGPSPRTDAGAGADACAPGSAGCTCFDESCDGDLQCLDGVCSAGEDAGPPRVDASAGEDAGMHTPGAGPIDADAAAPDAGDAGTRVPVCGDGVVEPPEMCEPGEPSCADDCRYPSGHIFWTETPEDVGWGAAFDANGSPYVLLSRGGSVGGDGAGDYVRRYARDGSTVWHERWRNVSWNLIHGFGLAARPGGGVIVLGQVNTGPEHGNDGFAGSVDADGNIGWGRQLEIEHNDWIVDGVVLDDGSVVAVGGHNQHPERGDRAWIASVGSSGQVEWDHETQGYDDAGYYEVTHGTGGAVVVFGCCDQEGELFLREYDSSGNVQWTTPTPGLSTQAFNGAGMDVDPDGNFVVVATTEDGEPWLGRYASDGTPLWDATPTASELGDVTPQALAVTPQNRYVVGGHGLDSGSYADIWYGVFDTAGALLSSERVAGSAGKADELREVVTDSRGVVLMVGRITQSGGSLGDSRGWVRMFAP